MAPSTAAAAATAAPSVPTLTAAPATGWLEEVAQVLDGIACGLSLLEAESVAPVAGVPAAAAAAASSSSSSSSSEPSAASAGEQRGPAAVGSADEFMRLVHSSPDSSSYTLHLRHIVGSVAASPRTAHLLSESERRIAQSITGGLSPAGVGLLARLCARKGPWFRAASFSRYPELLQQPTGAAGAAAAAPAAVEGGAVDDHAAPPAPSPPPPAAAGATRLLRVTEDIPAAAVQHVVAELCAGGLLLPLPLGSSHAPAGFVVPTTAAAAPRRSSIVGQLPPPQPQPQLPAHRDLALQLECVVCAFSAPEVKALLSKLNIRATHHQRDASASTGGGAAGGSARGEPCVRMGAGAGAGDTTRRCTLEAGRTLCTR